MSIREVQPEEVDTMVLPPVPPTGFHHTRGVYLNGDQKSNGVAPEHLRSHIRYNLSLRPGRALFVDGKCLNRGYLREEQCLELEKQLAGERSTRCTAPYH